MDQNSQNNPNTTIQMAQITQDHQNQNPTHFLDLLSGESYFQNCMPLRKAALEGNWKEAKRIFENLISRFSTTRQYSLTDVLHMPITEGRQTILHVATGAGQTTFVEEILKSREQHDVFSLLTLQDENANNAFCFAAATGRVEIAELMIGNEQSLPTVRGNQNKTPLYMAVLFGQHKMAEFLYPKTQEILEEEDVKALFFKSITTDLYDIALELLLNHPTFALEEARDGNNGTALHMLARKPSASANKRTGLHITQALQLVKRLTQKIIQIQDQNVANQIFKESLFDAAKLGNFEFLVELVRSYPDLIHLLDEQNRTIFHIAILYRHVDIFSLIYEMGFDMKLLTTYEDNEGNNMLHLAAIYSNPTPASVVPGAALELQRELLLFKEVENIVPPTYRGKKNNGGRTPKELFTIDHEVLRKLGEKWMRSTANSCMLVATLIATVIYTSVSTVPGGSHDKIGIPIHLNKTMFKVFVMSNATALTSSCTSILMFLSILTSRYREQDFFKSLPLKLICGLLTLFISVVSMVVAFCSSIFLYYPYHERLNWMPVSIAILVSFPIITSYGWLAYSLGRAFSIQHLVLGID